MELSISSVTLDADCANVALNLKEAGFHFARVTPNTTLWNGQTENGCCILVSKSTNCFELWRTVQTMKGIGCAHLKVNGEFDGCIEKYLAKTKCRTETQLD